MLKRMEEKARAKQRPNVLKIKTSRSKPVANVSGYCMTCKAKRGLVNASSYTNKKGRPAVTGKCSTCNRKIFVFTKTQK